MSGRRSVGALFVALVLVLVASGCGIDPESTAHRAPPDEVPFGLLEDPAAAPEVQPSGRVVTVFLFGDERLVPVERSAPTATAAGEVVDLLVAGPTAAERTLGLSSSLPEGQVLDVAAARGVAEVDLAGSFVELNTQDQARSIAQLTYTLTGQPGIGRVSFTLDGAATEVPRGDGTLTADALAREDFAELAPVS